ncbi:MAG: tetratricopeptide repeat protein [Promethearchaeota archaeon]|jgi:tetratricopeptide (TPR) repeat protein
MSYSLPDELIHVRHLLDEDKYQETFDVLNKFEKIKEISSEDLIECLLIKGELHYILFQRIKATNIAEQAFQISKDQGNELQTFDALFLKVRCLILLREDELSQLLNQLENVYLSFKDVSPTEKHKREANLNRFKATVSLLIENDYDKAIEFCDRSLVIREKLGNKSDVAQALLVLSGYYADKGDLSKSLKYAKKSLTIKEIRKRDKCEAFSILGAILSVRGELDHALEYTEQLKKISDEINHKYWRIAAMCRAGFIFRLKGDLDQALEYFKSGLISLEESGLFVGRGNVFFNLIRIYVEKGLNKKAKRYLTNFKQFVDQVNVKFPERLYQLSNGLVLKASSNIRDHFKAEMILKEFIKINNFPRDFIITAITYLCDLLIMELRRTNDLSILEELNPLINQFSNFAEDQESYWRLADAKILQAKLALIQMNMGEARRFLTQAQIIADEHGLGLMAQKISSEHDTLLNQLSKWEKFKEDKAPISDRIELSSLDDVVERLLEKRTVEPTKILDEQPMLLLILAEGGVLLFSYPFTDDWQRNNELFGSFLSAISSFSDEFFYEGVDRFKFGQYTVLIEEAENISIHYLFNGQTYLAKKKLKYFKEKIQTSPSIWQTFEKFFKTGQSIELKDFPFLEAFITDIFLGKLSKLLEA